MTKSHANRVSFAEMEEPAGKMIISAVLHHLGLYGVVRHNDFD